MVQVMFKKLSKISSTENFLNQTIDGERSSFAFVNWIFFIGFFIGPFSRTRSPRAVFLGVPFRDDCLNCSVSVTFPIVVYVCHHC